MDPQVLTKDYLSFHIRAGVVMKMGEKREVLKVVGATNSLQARKRGFSGAASLYL